MPKKGIRQKKHPLIIPKETLEMIDEYVKMISGINRSLVINGVLSTGFNHYLDLIEEGIERALNKEKLGDEKDRSEFIKFKKNLKSFRDKNPVLKFEEKNK